MRFNKPFVEKPVSGEDHNICIYYPRNAGGGSQRLFRKVGDRSSQFYPDVHTVRRNGSYIYEVNFWILHILTIYWILFGERERKDFVYFYKE